MTTLYRTVLIESAEQAEALDWKTPVQIVLDRTREVHDVKLFEDFAEDFWPDALEPGNRWVYVALVPIEAEEETRSVARHPGGGQTNYNAEAAGNPGRMGEYIASLPVESRYVTPWEAS